MNEQKEVYTRTCCRCKCEYKSSAKKSYVCPDCKRERERATLKQRNENCKKPKVIAHYRPAADVGIFRFVRIVDRYNTEHGTSYSYGKFVQLVSNRKINFNEAARDA